MKRSKPSTSSAGSKKKTIQEHFQNSDSDDDEKFKGFLQQIQKQRSATAKDITEFRFDKKRVRLLSAAKDVAECNTGGILYWMSRDMRVQDNWALLFAQKLAYKVQQPLLVAFCLVPKFLNATLRHYKFLLGGLKEVERDCAALNIPFHLLLGPAVQRIPELVRSNRIGAVVCDFAPLRVPRQWVDDVLAKLPNNVPLTQVDAHNVVPVWVASEKQEYAARTIRNKINTKLTDFLTEFPPLVKHPFGTGKKDKKTPAVDWEAAYASLECDRSVDEVQWARPGYRAACEQLQRFCEKRLKLFNDKRNDPTVNALSGLSPWFHFGQISVQRSVLEVNRFQSKHKESVAAFCEEAIVRRELADNFCYYNENYDNLQGLHAWALKTLQDHRNDKRSHLYTLEEFEQGHTHDDLWNAAQLQLVREGKMHGFLRMYWAKKILEWTESPEQALEFSILINDKFSLDGRDPNGYVGCMWSIGGVHDQGWAERSVFGKIRYMNYQGCKRKFDVAAFVSHYGAKVYTKNL